MNKNRILGTQSFGKKAKKLLATLLCLGVLGALSGCASDNLKAPCADYGHWCSKTPINSWNYNK